MARFYGDENFPLPAILALRAFGHDILTIQETGQAGDAVPDAEVLSYATSLGRAILTLNRRDFIRLHQASMQHAGIVVCTFDSDFSGQARRIHEATMQQGDLDGRLVRVNRLA